VNLSVIGKKSEPKVFEYDCKDAILYALGIGAQTDELDFLYENAPGGFKVFPSFGTLVLARHWDILDPLETEQIRTIHSGHSLRLYRPIPPRGRLLTVAQISNIYDKGRAAIIIILIEACTEEGDPVFDNEAVLYYIGGGGFGGDRGPKAEVLRPREGVDPDFRVAYSIPENQAALYRLSGDFNPLHIDPELAKTVRFDKPILHGLCTFGYATRALVHSVCDADVSRLKEFRARFSAPVYPGETLNVEGWKDEGGRFIMQARTARAAVLTNGCAVVGE